MSPIRAARFLAQLGAAILLLLVGLRIFSFLSHNDNPASSSPEKFEQPYLGGYTYSPSGAQVSFEQGSIPPGEVSPGDDARTEPFWLDLASGAVTPGALPVPDTTPFVMRSQRLFLEVGEGVSLVIGSPASLLVIPTSLARSPDGSMMAFTAEDPVAGEIVLGVLYASGQFTQLVQAPQIGSPDWSPDGQALTFAMKTAQDESMQVYRISNSGGNAFPLTSGAGQRAMPRWSPDGQTIAYLFKDEKTHAIMLVSANGGLSTQLLADEKDLAGLVWAGSARTLAYHKPSAGWPSVRALYLVDSNSGADRRMYPQLEIDSLICPTHLPSGASRTAQLTISNSGPSAVLFQITLRAGPDMLPPLNRPAQTGGPTLPPNQLPVRPTAQPRTSASQSQPFALNPGQSKTIDWKLSPAFGLDTYISARIDPPGQIAVVERHCTIPNTYLGLPNLPFLPSTLPLGALGTLLCVPWLRHKKDRRAWMLLAFVWVLIVGLVAAETIRVVL